MRQQQLTWANRQYGGIGPSRVSFRGIVIEDDVWIGSKVTILDGVTVGRGAIIGAGSVVVKSVRPFQVVAGVPARVLRSRLNQTEVEPSDWAREELLNASTHLEGQRGDR